MADLIGQVINQRYRVDESLGSSGMADVYKVWDIQRETYRAMKHLREDITRDAAFLNRFKRETKQLERLLHPNIVRFHGLEESGGQIFMLMDFVDRITLRKALMQADGVPFTAPEIWEIMQPICSALQYAHQMRIIHGGLKPVNIMIENSGWVQVAEFGISRHTLGGGTYNLADKESKAYMAPEQNLGEDPTPQTDIYALGLVLFELLTGGERPFTSVMTGKTGSSKDKNQWEKSNSKPVSPRQFNPQLSTSMELVVQKCLAADPTDRYKSTLEFLDALQAALREYTPRSSPTEEAKSASAPPESVDIKKSEPFRAPKPVNKVLLFVVSILAIVLVVTGLILRSFFFGSPNNPTKQSQGLLASEPLVTPIPANIMPTSISTAVPTLPLEPQATAEITRNPDDISPLILESNGSANTNNAGLATTRNGWIYYRNDSDNGKIYRESFDGTKKEPLNNDNSYNIIVDGDWVYYRNDSNAGRVYRVPVAGGESQKLNDEFSGYINVAEGWIFYQNHTGGDTIYRMRLDGSEHEKLTVGESAFIQVFNDWVYFVNNSDGHKIYRMRLDGSEMKKISDDFSSGITITSDKIFYITRNLVFNSANNSSSTDMTTINRMELDGSQKETLITIKGGSINGYLNVFEDWIYYIPDISFVTDDKGNSINVGGLMYRFNLIDNNRETIFTQGSTFINIAGDWVYFRKGGPGGKIHRMRLDGSNEEIVL